MVGVTGSIPVAPTTQSGRTADFRGISEFRGFAGLSRHFFRDIRSLRAAAVAIGDFGGLSLRQKFPFLAARLVS